MEGLHCTWVYCTLLSNLAFLWEFCPQMCCSKGGGRLFHPILLFFSGIVDTMGLQILLCIYLSLLFLFVHILFGYKIIEMWKDDRMSPRLKADVLVVLQCLWNGSSQLVCLQTSKLNSKCHSIQGQILINIIVDKGYEPWDVLLGFLLLLSSLAFITLMKLRGE